MKEERTPRRNDYPSREPSNGAKPRPDPCAESVEHAPDEYDALTELFLGGVMSHDGQSASEIVQGAAAVHRRAEVEIVVGVCENSLGAVLHYADGRAGEMGKPVVVVHVTGRDDGSVTILGASGDRPSVETLSHAIESASALEPTWIVLVSDAFTGEAARMCGVSRVIVACAADEAGVVAAYRALKSIVSVQPSMNVGLMVHDAPPEVAARAADKIVRCADAFLGRRIELVSSRSSPMPASKPMFVGPVGGPLESIIDLLQRQSAKPEPARVREGVPGRDAVPLGKSARGERRSTTLNVPSSLAETVGGDLSPLTVRCPHAESIEIAVDPRGTIHLLALANAETEGSYEKCVALLIAAGAWVRKHVTLIAAAEVGVRSGSSAAAPVLHLVTDRLAEIRHLLDADIRVHLLAPVRESSGVQWACADLN